MDWLDIQKLKDFFQALKATGFKPNPILPSFVDKPYCLQLLRRLPQFQAEQFKDDNVLINTVVQYLKDPKKINNILGEFTQSQQEEFRIILEEKPAAAQVISEQPSVQEAQPPVGGEPASTMAGGVPPFPGIGGGVAATTPRRVIRVVPQTKPLGASQTVPGLKTTPETGLDYEGKPYGAGELPVDNVSKEATQPPKGIRGGGRSFQTPKVPYQITNAAKNLGSGLGRFTKLNSSRVANGFGNLLGGIGRGGGGLLSGVAGGGGRFFTRVGLGGADAMVRFSNQISRGSIIKGPPKKVWLILLGSFLLMGVLAAFAPAPGQPGQPGQPGTPSVGGTCPDQTTIDANKKDPNTCRYFNLGVNLFDINIPQSAIDTYISSYSNIFIGAGLGDINEFRRRVDYIVSSAKSAGLNPVLFLGYWKTESNFSTIGNRDLGCSSDAVNFDEQVDCALGVRTFSDPRKNPIANCARSKDANSAACQALKSVRSSLDQTNPIKYPIATFDDFAEAHGSRDPRLDCKPDGTCTVNNNCISTYNKLVEVAKQLNACQTSITPPLLPPSGGAVASCPIPGGSISTPSYNADPARGHCGGSYSYSYACKCGTSGRRAKAIDVPTGGNSVVLPKIEGQDVTWKLIVGPYGVDSQEGGGVGYTFEARLGPDRWYLDMLHLNQSTLTLGGDYPSGTPVATTTIGHVHMTIGKNLASSPVAGSNTDCDLGWLPSDFMCK